MDDSPGTHSEDQGDKGYDTASSEIKDIQMSEVSSDETTRQGSSRKSKQKSKHVHSHEKLADIMEGIFQVMKDRENDPKISVRRRRRRPQQVRKSAIDNEVQVLKRTEPSAIRNLFLVRFLLLLRICAYPNLSRTFAVKFLRRNLE